MEEVVAYLPSGDVLHDLLFPGEGSLLPPVNVAVGLGHEERDEVNPTPHLLALQLAENTKTRPTKSATLIKPGLSPGELDQLGLTCRFSRLPNPTRQKPNAHTAATAPNTTAPPGPRIGRLRLYLIASNPPDGGMSLRADQRGTVSTRPRGGEPAGPETCGPGEGKY